MNSLNKFSVLIILCVIWAITAYAQECKDTLKVITDLDSAVIYIGGKPEGKGTLQTELTKGEYKITAAEPAGIWDARKFTDTVIFRGCGESRTLKFLFNSSVYLQTEPQDAFVYTRDTLLGSTPLFVPSFEKILKLEKEGYKTKSVSLASLPPANTVNLDFTGKPNGKSFFERGIFKILVGSLVVLGGTTAYFKLKADDRFSQYESTGTQSYLDQTRKYDLISGITMGALEINFGILIYYFMTD